MSFEGYDEYICENKHYYGVNCYASCEVCHPLCPVCHGVPLHWHLVDQTNGEWSNDPNTYPAKTKDVGFEDIWHVDHYGNNYATKRMLFEPDSEAWRKIKG